MLRYTFIYTIVKPVTTIQCIYPIPKDKGFLFYISKFYCNRFQLSHFLNKKNIFHALDLIFSVGKCHHMLLILEI